MTARLRFSSKIGSNQPKDNWRDLVNMMRKSMVLFFVLGVFLFLLTPSIAFADALQPSAKSLVVPVLPPSLDFKLSVYLPEILFFSMASMTEL